MFLANENIHMDPDEVLHIIEEQILYRKLSPAERIVLDQTWNKQTYDQMAKHSGYGDAHLKDTGYKLWREISQVLGQRVTKKSLLFVLREHLQESSLPPSHSSEHKFPVPTPKQAAINPISKQLQYPSGPLSPTSSLYINRPPSEDLAYAEVRRPGGFLRIKAPQKMGKTSLVFRIIQAAEQQGFKTAHLDLQTVDKAVYASMDTFLKWFCLRVSKELKIPPKLDEYWDSLMGYKVSSELYYQEHILEQIQTPIVLIISAAEDLIAHPELAQDFFPLLRYWHEKSKWSPLWRNLRIVIVHATEIHIPLKINQSPFNIGQSIKLTGFTALQVQELATRYGLEQIDSVYAQQLVSLLGGHPYLVNVFFYHLVTQNLTVESLIQTASAPSGIYSNHLRSYLVLLRQDSNLTTALKKVVSTENGVELDAVTLYQLESLGLVKVNEHRAVCSCDVYCSYFQQQLSFE